MRCGRAFWRARFTALEARSSRCHPHPLWSDRSNKESVGVCKCLKNGAGDGTRTHDVQLGGLPLA